MALGSHWDKGGGIELPSLATLRICDPSTPVAIISLQVLARAFPCLQWLSIPIPRNRTNLDTGLSATASRLLMPYLRLIQPQLAFIEYDGGGKRRVGCLSGSAL
jgi:hypothetical protein